MIDLVLFDTIRLPNLEVIADDWGSKIIIGRDVLNKLHLLLDGPNETVKLKEQVFSTKGAD
jgi:hypothetical protein